MLALASHSESTTAFASSRGTPVPVRLCRITFRAYLGETPPRPRTYAVKPIVLLGEEPLFAELAILRLAETQGFEGVWVDTFHGSRKLWTRMPVAGEESVLPPERQELLDRIRRRHGRRGGTWDVFA